MAMKPWYRIVYPREDLRAGKPLDASEFAVHLDHVRDGRAPSVYQDPAQFFERTFLTHNLRDLAAQVVRRLSGITLETSPIFNLSTQFGGGKTHSLTLLYHLAKHGNGARSWKGVNEILKDAGVADVPAAATAVFVGTEFDSIAGRGGSDGTPYRRTPWGEIAYQIGDHEGFRLLEEHDKSLTAPGGDVIEKMLPTTRPTLILLDELMNYVSRNRRSGLGGQIYNFLHTLSEVARARNNVVLAVSIPAAELEMSPEDQSDFERFKKLLDRLGKAVIMSAETETSEIIRRRLFEWQGLPGEALETVREYEAWIHANREQIPSWFPADNARSVLKAYYPFHPSVLSVFERKWQGLPRFQQTRGILRLLALWVSKAYSDGYTGAHKDPLISLGTAPLEDSIFRAALFEQLGEARLETAVTTDIAGSAQANALRLDIDARPEVKKARLHRKVATAILFESNGGQQKKEASLGEIRLAVAEPGLDIGTVEQCLDALTDNCYYLTASRNRYRFSTHANLNKLLADRRANISSALADERARKAIHDIFSAGKKLDPIFFPRKSSDVSDRPVLTLVVLPPELPGADPTTASLITAMIAEYGTTSRTFKSALLWTAADNATAMMDESRKLLAWLDIKNDSGEITLDDSERQQIDGHTRRAEQALKEAVWRAYRYIFLLAADSSLHRIDLGLLHVSSATSMVDLILSRLKQDDLATDGVGPIFLNRLWPPALPEWSTKSVRDTFYASPKFPRLLTPDTVKETISRGVAGGTFAYVGKGSDGSYVPFVFNKPLAPSDIEITDDIYLITRERAEQYLAAPATGATAVIGERSSALAVSSADLSQTDEVSGVHSESSRPTLETHPMPGHDIAGFQWTGEIPPQKWTYFYTKVLSKFATGGGIKLVVTAEVDPPEGLPKSKLDEIKIALRELGLTEALDVKPKG